ncbi:hypothetical protein UPYG_G00198440 [Umbra pygmaea]|uniref:OCA domain-containing protein n=1 Tax=Umbra pygmaea TaxID=75934 RepID=A0ABD0WN18_UMBPY
MGGRYKSKEKADNTLMKIHTFEGKQNIDEGLLRSYKFAVAEELVSDLEGPNSTTGSKCSSYDSEKQYLGVRVKMPVRDILRNIRIAKGMDPKDAQDSCGKALKGAKKRVNTKGGRRCNKRKCPTMSLEELAIIVEVLEEDLRKTHPYTLSNKSDSTKYCPEPNEQPCDMPKPLQHTYPMRICQENKIQQQAPYYYMSEHNLSCSQGNENAAVPPLNSHDGYVSDESDNMISSPESYMSYSPSSDDQIPSPQHSVLTQRFSSYEQGQDKGSESQGKYRFSQQYIRHMAQDGISEDSFWTQLQREESLLTGVPDTEFLTTDSSGRTVLHIVTCQGERPLAYAIAKRMAALNSLDIKDLEGKTALHMAAQNNRHLIMADLIRLGACVNQKDQSGKTCLHVSAENGYVQVTEMLNNLMKEGIYVDVEAKDNSGLSVLQYAAMALDVTMQKLDTNLDPSQRILHTRCKEQLLETLKCLLEMGSYLPTLNNGCGDNEYEMGSFIQDMVSSSNLGELHDPDNVFVYTAAP